MYIIQNESLILYIFYGNITIWSFRNLDLVSWRLRSYHMVNNLNIWLKFTFDTLTLGMFSFWPLNFKSFHFGHLILFYFQTSHSVHLYFTSYIVIPSSKRHHFLSRVLPCHIYNFDPLIYKVKGPKVNFSLKMKLVHCNALFKMH